MEETERKSATAVEYSQPSLQVHPFLWPFYTISEPWSKLIKLAENSYFVLLVCGRGLVGIASVKY